MYSHIGNDKHVRVAREGIKEMKVIWEAQKKTWRKEPDWTDICISLYYKTRGKEVPQPSMTKELRLKGLETKCPEDIVWAFQRASKSMFLWRDMLGDRYIEFLDLISRIVKDLKAAKEE